MGLNIDRVYLEIAYLIAAVCFIVGLRMLSSPATARQGNRVAALGMGIAILATFFEPTIALENVWLIILGALIGGGVGLVLARSVQMTAMPQMVAIFNGMGGGAAALTSTSEFVERLGRGGAIPFDVSLATILGVVIGSVSFSGSIVAVGKLQGFISTAPITYRGQQLANGLIFAAIAVSAIYIVGFSPDVIVLSVMIALSLILGVALVLPIGGADMPVVISLLNSFTGLAAAFTGFVLRSNVLIISGALVGASGTLLTQLMSKAMNRPLTNVLFGAFGSAGADLSAAASAAGRSIREVTVDDAATMLAYANQVIIVPGYGMAVARAQNAVHELSDILEQKGVEVKYAIHPVAGRMPGHMNVLLAEADVPYNQLYEMDDVNSEFGRTDVALVIGANDVVNPAARSDPKSPIYGMPILDVDRADNVIVMKRSMRSGFAGIENELFYDTKTSMLFGDAKETAEQLVATVKHL